MNAVAYWAEAFKMICLSFILWPRYRYSLVGFYRDVLVNAPVKRLRLRDGAVLQSSSPGTVLQQFLEIWHRKVYNPPGFEIGASDNVLDVGAHVGGFTLWAARKTGGTVVAVEPLDSAFESLQRTIESNRLTKVRAVNAAVAEKLGLKRISLIPGTNMGSTLRAAQPAITETEVPCVTLRQLVEELGHVDFLKMDVEGAEFEILDTLDRSLATRIRRIALEYHDGYTNRDHRWLSKRMSDLGYETRIASPAQGATGYLYCHRISS